MGSLRSSPAGNREINHLVMAIFCDRNPNSGLTNWMECYDPATNSWRRIGLLPDIMDNHVIKGFATVSIGDSVFIIGGKLTNKRGGEDYGNDPDDIVENDVAVLPTVWRYNVSTDEWFSCASLDTPRFDFACTVCDNRIYVAGGQSTLGSARGIISAEVYDPARDEWTILPDMGTARYKCVGVAWQGKFHVVGGFADVYSNIYSPARSSAEVYDTSRAKWVQVGMWRLDVPPNQIVPVNGRLFSSGDCLNAWKGHIEAYDEKLNIWDAVDGSHLQMLSSPRSTSDSPNQRIFLTMAPIGTYLYFLAGYRSQGELVRSMSIVHRFDTSAVGDPWRSVEPMEEEGDKELCSHCCVVQV